MKTILITIFALLASLFASAQWTEVNSGTNAQLNSVFFVTSNVGYAVGQKHGNNNKGIILKTQDGGANWSIIDTSYSNLFFEKVAFFNSDTGIIISKEKILRTLNGGQSWQLDSIDSLRNNDLNLNGSLAYIVGGVSNAGGTKIYNSTDFGATWSLHYFSDLTFLGPISFVDSALGFASIGNGGGISFNKIYKTVDGGQSWQEINFKLINQTWHKDIFFVDSLLGFSAGFYSEHLMKTTDGGNTWQALNVDRGNMPTTYFISMYDSVIYAGGPKLFRSKNLGSNWEEQQFPSTVIIPSPLTNGMNDLFMIDKDTAVAVGYGGTIIRTTNGGGTVGIKENSSLKKKIKVYPNPAKELLNIENKSNLKIEQLFLKDISGKVVRNFNRKELRLDVSGLVSGNYLLQIVSNEGQFAKKVVLE
jgi:photosystem II stability/assembly factor-like uncharacterized protein